MMKKGKGQNVTSYDKLYPNLSLPSWKVVGLRLGEVLELGVRSANVSLLLVSIVPFCLTR